MGVRKQYSDVPGIYFITFTCFNWTPLFKIAAAWNSIYNQFDFLESKGNRINAYVLMPNHLHLLIYFSFSDTFSNMKIQSGSGYINKSICTMKRFLAYEIVELLAQKKQFNLLQKLSFSVTQSELIKGKKHQIFEPSFDCKLCISESMVLEKLNYIHQNPCRGKWNLAPYPSAYLHSSAAFYETGNQGIYPVTDYRFNDWV